MSSEHLMATRIDAAFIRLFVGRQNSKRACYLQTKLSLEMCVHPSTIDKPQDNPQ